MLVVDKLEKRYAARKGEPAGGVFGVSFEVTKGELFTLLGPSGCGKTTTLRSIAGLETPDIGVIRLDGQALFDGATGATVPMYERDIGMVFQSYAIWPHMSVFENAAYPLRVMRRGRPTRAEIDTRVSRVLEMVGLGSFKGRSATQLSGGQQQRLALARALVREPKLLLLDEPLSNLDAQLREQMRAELKRIQADWGVTTIYVTHDQAEAMAISDRIAVMNQGLIIQVGAPPEIYERPRSEFVAQFIGRTNMLRGKVAGVDGDMGTVATEIGTLRCMLPHDARVGEEITFVVRPEHVVLSGGGGSAVANTVDGQCIGRTYLGEIAEYTVATAGGQHLIARASPDISVQPGGAVRVALPFDKLVAVRA